MTHLPVLTPIPELVDGAQYFQCPVLGGNPKLPVRTCLVRQQGSPSKKDRQAFFECVHCATGKQIAQQVATRTPTRVDSPAVPVTTTVPTAAEESSLELPSELVKLLDALPEVVSDPPLRGGMMEALASIQARAESTQAELRQLVGELAALVVSQGATLRAELVKVLAALEPKSRIRRPVKAPRKAKPASVRKTPNSKRRGKAKAGAKPSAKTSTKTAQSKRKSRLRTRPR